MTNRNKITLLSAALLAVLVIVTIIAACLHPGAYESMDTASAVLYCCVATAGILSVVIVYLATVRKRKYESQLTTEYFTQYEIIRDAVGTSQLTAVVKNEIRHDLLDLLLSAQDAGKTAKSVVGDPEQFAKDIIRSYTKPGYSTVFRLLDAIVTFSAFVLGTTVFLWLEQTSNGFFHAAIGIDIVSLFIVLAAIIVPVTKRLIASRSRWAYSVPIASGIGFIVVTMLLRQWFYDIGWVRDFLDGTVRMIPNPYILCAYILSILLLLLFKYRLRRAMLRQTIQ